MRLAGRASRVVVVSIENTNHTFANLAGRTAVRQYIEGWLSTNFPLLDQEDTTERVLPKSVYHRKNFHPKSRTGYSDLRTAAATMNTLWSKKTGYECQIGSRSRNSSKSPKSKILGSHP